MKARSNKYLAFLSLASLAIVMICWSGMVWCTLSLYSNAVISDMGCLDSEFMLIITLISMTNSLVSMFFFGRLVEKFGIKKYMLLCGLTCTVAYLIMALAPNIQIMWLAAGMAGAGVTGLNSNSVNVVVNAWFKKNATKWCSIVQMFASGSGILFSSVWGRVIQQYGWRITMGITFVTSGVCSLLIYWLNQGRPEDHGLEPLYAEEAARDRERNAMSEEEAAGISYKEMLRNKQFVLLALAYLLLGLVGYSVMGNLTLIVTRLGFTMAVAGKLLSVAYIFQAVSLPVLGTLIDKVGSKWVIAGSLVMLSVACIILLSGTQSILMLYVVAILQGIMNNSTQLPIGASIREAFGRREFEKKMGTIAAFDYFGIAVAPVAFSAFYDLIGSYHVGFIVIIAGAALAAFLFFPATKWVGRVAENH